MKTFFDEQRRNAIISTWLNILAAAINILAWAHSAATGGWIGWINLPIALFSAYTAWTVYLRLDDIEDRRRDYINDVLRGKYG